MRASLLVVGPSPTAIGECTSRNWAVSKWDGAVDNCNEETLLIAIGTSSVVVGPSIIAFGDLP